MKTQELIERIKPLKIVGAKKKAEQFVNVGIEAVIRLLQDNAHIIDRDLSVEAALKERTRPDLKDENDALYLRISQLEAALKKVEDLIEAKRIECFKDLTHGGFIEAKLYELLQELPTPPNI